MPRQATVISDAVAQRARGIVKHVRKVEALGGRRELTRTDIERIYSGSFVLFHTYLERSIEKLFIGLLVGRLASTHRRTATLVTVRSDVVAHKIVRAGRQYADWLPFRAVTLKRADAFFSGGRPFTELTASDIQALDDIQVIRNALAHESSASLKKFSSRFTERRSLPPSQRRPAGFLRGAHAGRQTRLEFFLSRGVQSMITLCK